jgi:hypothetical protein
MLQSNNGAVVGGGKRLEVGGRRGNVKCQSSKFKWKYGIMELWNIGIMEQ